MIHGRNDPRVPVGETGSSSPALNRRGAGGEPRIYDDEGHALARLANQLDAYHGAIEFLDQVLPCGAPTSSPSKSNS